MKPRKDATGKSGYVESTIARKQYRNTGRKGEGGMHETEDHYK